MFEVIVSICELLLQSTLTMKSKPASHKLNSLTGRLDEATYSTRPHTTMTLMMHNIKLNEEKYTVELNTNFPFHECLVMK